MSICKAPWCLVTELQRCKVWKSIFITHVRYLWFYIIGSTRSSFHNTITIAEGETSGEIVPYHFEPVSVSNYSNLDTSSSKSETDIEEQVSFTERLGSRSWYECTKCTPIPSGIECQCCMEMEGVAKCVAENESHQCITDHEQFKVVCLNKDVYIQPLLWWTR